MDLEEIKRGLRAEIKKRENEQYFTFQCNVRQMCKDVLAKLEEQEVELADKNKELRHQKFKRCLDKAKWCEAEVRNIRRTPFCDMSEHEGWQHDDDFWQRWRKRWLELAEQFKVAK